jgi:hypothetical protein
VVFLGDTHLEILGNYATCATKTLEEAGGVGGEWRGHADARGEPLLINAGGGDGAQNDGGERKKEKKEKQAWVVVVEAAATACQAVPATIALSPAAPRFRHTDSDADTSNTGSNTDVANTHSWRPSDLPNGHTWSSRAVEALATPLVHIARSLAAETGALIGGGGTEEQTTQREPLHHLPLHLRARQLQVPVGAPPIYTLSQPIPVLTYPHLY